MILETIIGALVPVGIDGIKSLIGMFTGGVKPISVDEQIKLVDFYEQVRTGTVDGYGYTDIEINKIKRIKDWLNSDLDDFELDKNRKDFYQFITEHDIRRNTDFCKTFPELEEFYKKCKNI